MKRPSPKWESEAAMLTAFVAEAKAMGFRVLPEACGHDLVLVAPDVLPERRGYAMFPEAIAPGDCIAVEGKLRATIEVLRQAIPPDRRERHGGRCHRPTGIDGLEFCGTCQGCTWMRGDDTATALDFYAVVIPDGADTWDFRIVAAALGVCVWTMRAPIPADPGDRWSREAPAALMLFDVLPGARVLGRQRPAIPELDVDMVAGTPAPRRLTPWKIAAVRLCLLGMERDLTTADFAAHPPCTARSLVDRGWAELVGRTGRTGVYRLTDSPTRPDRAYPEIAAAIRAQRPVTAEERAAAVALPAAPIDAPRPAGALFARSA